MAASPRARGGDGDADGEASRRRTVAEGERGQVPPPFVDCSECGWATMSNRRSRSAQLVANATVLTHQTLDAVYKLIINVTYLYYATAVRVTIPKRLVVSRMADNEAGIYSAPRIEDR